VKIVVINTNTSNITSVVNAFKYVGADVLVSDEAEVILRADKAIIPGVGSFSAGYNGLVKNKLVDTIRQIAVKQEKPVLGICLGMQMLATASEEGGDYKGLDLIPGRVKKLKNDQPEYRIPNIGWCDVRLNRENVLINEYDKILSFYHIHSFYFDCDNNDHVVGTIIFSGKDVPVMVQRKNVFGVQFHPEKSHECGLELLSNFVKL